jgi:hypothetical protein
MKWRYRAVLLTRLAFGTKANRSDQLIQFLEARG